MKNATPVGLTFRTLIISLLLRSAAAAAPITVTSTADSGSGSLRQALLDAQSLSDAKIEFSLPPGSTITLTSGALVINTGLRIFGPGANLLTVQRSTAAGTPKFRVFHVAQSSGQVDITGLTIANGDVSGGFQFGGGILNEGNLTLSGVTISGNAAFGGGGIANPSASLTVSNSTISGNRAFGGGGGGISGGTVTLRNSTVSGNNAKNGNAGGIAAGNVSLVDTTVSENSASGNGGGIFNSGTGGATVHAENSIIALNTAGSGPDVAGSLTSRNFNIIGDASGANITPPPAPSFDQVGVTAAQLNLSPLQDNGGPTKTHALLAGSVAIDRGNSEIRSDQRGFIRTVDSPPLLNAGAANGSDIGAYEVQWDSLPGCVSVVENLNDAGAGSLRAVIANACAGDTISFASNVRGTISLTSGKLVINKVLTINGPGAHLLTVERNASAPNFRIFDIEALPDDFGVTIAGLTIANGRFFNSPGGGIASHSRATIARCIITGNAADSGGGIHFRGVLTVIDSTISGNSALNDGGGIYTRSSRLTISGSTLYANAADQGGAIWSIGDSDETAVTITDSTVSSNQASDNGGGIFVMGGESAPALLSITSSTIVANFANDAGGGIMHAVNSTFRLRNTIVAFNSSEPSPNIQGSVTSEGFNIIGESSGATITPSQSSDRVGVIFEQVALGQLSDNGGPTYTHALLPGSVAIDAGHSSGASTDQRGATRPANQPDIADAGDGADIGAFEFGGTLPTPSPTPTATPAPTATPVPNRLANISTRVRVETGENVLIGGFIVTGSMPKRVMVRAIGPSVDVEGRLANPLLELYDAKRQLIASNDNWQEAENAQEIIDSTIAPSNELEAAILRNVEPGVYTAVVRDAADGEGVGLVEVYDLGAAQDSQLANIATRGHVLTGTNIMIGGLIVTGSTPQKVIVRAIGPSLGIAGQLEDPVLELVGRNGELLASNNNWRDTQEAEITATTVPPSHELESAIVAFVPPDLYTAQVRGVNDATGVALVEVYALQ